MKNKIRMTFFIGFLLAISAVLINRVYAQSLEPRAYSNAPTGLNFLLVGYQNTSGALIFDPGVPITDASTKVDIGILGYIHTFGIAGKAAKAGVILPYASLSAEGKVDGEFRTRDTTGAADPTLFFSINFFGAPALTLDKFKNYRQDTIIGFTFKVTPPLGKYEPDRAINLGTNRWAFEPGLGISKALGRLTLETSFAALFFTDNNDFFNGKSRKQDNIYSTQFHVTYTFPRKIWTAISATYYTGGRTTIDDIASNDLQQNWRVGLTLALPVNRYNSIKLFGSRGVSTRTGTNFDVIGLAWQLRWGGGL